MSNNYKLADYWAMKAASAVEHGDVVHAAIIAHATRRFPPLVGSPDRRPVPSLEFPVDRALRLAEKERKNREWARREEEEKEARRQRELRELAIGWGGDE